MRKKGATANLFCPPPPPLHLAGTPVPRTASPRRSSRCLGSLGGGGGVGGADPSSTPPTPHTTILPPPPPPRATLMSSCAQLGCEEAKGWAERCPNRQMRPLRCSTLRWPLLLPIHTHGDWGEVGGGALGRSSSLLHLGDPRTSVGVPPCHVPTARCPERAGSLLGGRRSFSRRRRRRACGRCRCGRRGPGRC